MEIPTGLTPAEEEKDFAEDNAASVEDDGDDYEEQLKDEDEGGPHRGSIFRKSFAERHHQSINMKTFVESLSNSMSLSLDDDDYDQFSEQNSEIPRVAAAASRLLQLLPEKPERKTKEDKRKLKKKKKTKTRKKKKAKSKKTKEEPAEDTPAYDEGPEEDAIVENQTITDRDDKDGKTVKKGSKHGDKPLKKTSKHDKKKKTAEKRKKKKKKKKKKEDMEESSDQVKPYYLELLEQLEREEEEEEEEAHKRNFRDILAEDGTLLPEPSASSSSPPPVLSFEDMKKAMLEEAVRMAKFVRNKEEIVESYKPGGEGDDEDGDGDGYDSGDSSGSSEASWEVKLGRETESEVAPSPFLRIINEAAVLAKIKFQQQSGSSSSSSSSASSTVSSEENDDENAKEEAIPQWKQRIVQFKKDSRSSVGLVEIQMSRQLDDKKALKLTPEQALELQEQRLKRLERLRRYDALPTRELPSFAPTKKFFLTKKQLRKCIPEEVAQASLDRQKRIDKYHKLKIQTSCNCKYCSVGIPSASQTEAYQRIRIRKKLLQQMMTPPPTMTVTTTEEDDDNATSNALASSTHSSSLQSSSLHSPSLHANSLHSTSLHSTSLHSTTSSHSWSSSASFIGPKSLVEQERQYMEDSLVFLQAFVRGALCRAAVSEMLSALMEAMLRKQAWIEKNLR